jgi:hypothetical protein
MRPKLRLALTCVALLAGLLPLSILAAPQASLAHVIIRVTGPTGAPAAHVPILLVPAPDPAHSRMETDEKGQLSIELQAAGYALFIDFPGFKSVDTFIDVQDTKEIQIIPIRLESAGRGPQSAYADPAAPQGDLRISAHPYHDDWILTPAELMALPQTTVKVHNGHTKAEETYTGVRVADLLAKMDVPLGQKFRGVAVSDYLVATGSDGYVAVIALAEADPSFHSGDVMVADSMDGKPLDEKSGPFKLVVTDDKRHARWVRNLISLELKSAK